MTSSTTVGHPEPGPCILWIGSRKSLPRPIRLRLQIAGFRIFRSADSARRKATCRASLVVIAEPDQTTFRTDRPTAVIVDPNDYESMLRALESGAETLISRPLRASTILAAAARHVHRSAPAEEVRGLPAWSF